MPRWLGPLCILLLIGGGLVWLFSGARGQPDLDRSVIGTEGLRLVPGLDLRVAGEGGAPKASEVRLRLLPLYDVDLRDDRDESLGHTSLRNLPDWALWSKIDQAPTLILLPKWRAAAVETATAAPETAIPLADYARLFGQLNIGAARLQRLTTGFAAEGEARTLFLAQTFDPRFMPPGCSPALPFRSQALVLHCTRVTGAEYWVLSDPDLLTNHGLTLGGNAAAVGTLLRSFAAGPGTVFYLDRRTEDFLQDDAPPQSYERGPSELWRFFDPPLGQIWAMLAILLALFLWRGGRRFGPVVTPEEDRPERARSAAIANRARLIRLTGADAAMVADYVRTDLGRLAETVFGPGKGEVARLMPLLSRRDPEAAAAFHSLSARLMQAKAQSPAALRAALDTYHSLRRTLTHDA